MLILGLTGGIATGKSTVSAELASYGFPIIDADLIAREIVLPGRKPYQQIVSFFGPLVPDLLNADGSLNRLALGRAVFGQPERLAKLNGITHPAVRKEIFWRIFRAWLGLNRLVVLDVPLLFEAGMDKMCTKVVTVTCDEEIQLMRLLARNPELSVEDARNRMASQIGSEEKCNRSDVVIMNNSDFNALKRLVTATVAALLPSWWVTYLEMIPFVQTMSPSYTYIV
ncbi:hypothetical protein BABINDRAFT_171195 [Babjeviella inositovora NRRL Y-12698]|uniref:Dephospho-CoA kinase n=1 Tax=Babjeviella inositovora NRRL Y-12698 TaxID=984486 RepID=A0A1E3QR48_9ASCO|nr:uncharacterized protein BABINDRAFT_171195 [Babjeviella inositovora NRRL Y-12698]ODQ80173.1 hypothetical protein BABINDRAFT_171195 [Babjeviella inositovora NRRL Y-12698]